MRTILLISFVIELNQSRYELCWEMKMLGYEDAETYTLVKASSSVKFLHSSDKEDLGNVYSTEKCRTIPDVR